MKDQIEIITANEKIARFMGISVYQTYEEMQAVPLDQLKRWILPEQCIYDSSWNELMPVVEKISIIAHVDIKIQKSGGCSIWVDGVMISGAYNGTTIDQVYSCVVRFIDWYNEQNP